jgi:cell division protein FtsA
MFSAIDIGTTKIVALTGYTNSAGKIIVLGHGIVQSKNFNINKETENLCSDTIRQSICDAVETARREAGSFCEKVVVGVAGRFMRSYQNRIEFTRTIPYESISKEELERQCEQKINDLALPGEEILDVRKLQYCVDGQFYAQAPVGRTGSVVSLNVGIIKVKSNFLNQLRAVIESCNLQVEEFMFEPLASGAAVLSESDRHKGCTIIDIGGGTTDMAIYENGSLQFAEVIAFGGNSITNDIRQECISKSIDGGAINYASDDWKVAEALKVKHGKCIYNESIDKQQLTITYGEARKTVTVSICEVARVIHCRVSEILDSIHSLIDYSGCVKAAKREIILTGGGSELKDLAFLCEQKLQCAVRVAGPQNIICSSHFDCTQPRYATVVGLLMQAAKIHAQHYVAPKMEEKKLPELEELIETLTPVSSAPKIEAKAVQTKPEPKKETTKRPSLFSKMTIKIGQTVGEFAGNVFADTNDDNEIK